MSDWYDPSGVPGLGAPGASTVIKGEFESIGIAFSKMPPLAGHGLEYVRIYVGGTALESVPIEILTTELPTATTTTTGVVELATQTEVNTGTDEELVVTVNTLHEKVPNVRSISATAYTIVGGDKDDELLFTAATAVAITLPSDATENLAIGFMVHLQQYGAGQLTVTGQGGVTVNYSETNQTRTQYASLTVIKMASNEYLIIGDQAIA